MTVKLKCPVCDYEDITDELCPNCDNDLSIIRALMELKPYISKTSINAISTENKSRKHSIYRVLQFIILFLIAGGLGGFIFSRFQSDRNNYFLVLLAPPIVSIPTPSSKQVYIVQKGDNLTRIVKRFCGQDSSWQQIIDTNPHLSSRKDFLFIGEEIIIPDCSSKGR